MKHWITSVVGMALLAPAAAAAQSAVPPPDSARAPVVEERQGFTYRSEGRRDPFVSLMRRGSDIPATLRGRGLAALGTGEVTLRGTLESQGGYVGILQGADNRTYIVRPGDMLADGTIRAIEADAMVILQQISDPLSLERQREVRKVLRQTEEARP